jgi:hypothetical protein
MNIDKMLLAWRREKCRLLLEDMKQVITKEDMDGMMKIVEEGGDVDLNIVEGFIDGKGIDFLIQTDVEKLHTELLK